MTSLLFPPVFDDPDATAGAQVLHPMLLSINALMLLAMPVIALLEPSMAGRIAAGMLPILLMSAGLLWLERRGRVRLASGLLLAVLWASITGLVITGPGVSGPAFLAGYLTIIVIAGLLLGGRASVLVATGSTAVGLLLLSAEALRLWAPAPAFPARGVWGSAVFLFWVVVAAQGLWARVRREMLARAQAELAERRQAEAAREQYAARLEILREIDRAILAAHSPQETALAAVTRIRRIVPCLRAGVNLFDLQARRSTLLAVSLNGATQMGTGQSIPLEDYGLPAMESLRQGQPFIIEDVLASPDASTLDRRLVAEGVRAWLMTPLIVQGDLIGALNLGRSEPGPFGADEIAIAREVADQLAIAIRQARLLAQTTEALAREQRLNEASRVISGSLDLQTTLANIVRLAVDLVGAEAGSMSLIAPDGQTLSHPFLFNLPEGLGLDRPIPKGQGLSWHVIETRQPVLLQRYSEHPAALPMWTSTGLHSLIEVPVIAGEACLGTLSIALFDPARRLGERDLALVEALGRQAGVAIQNARLFANTRQRESELAALLDGARAVSSTLNLEAVLRQVTVSITRLLKMERCVLSTYEAEQDGVRTQAIYTAAGELRAIDDGVLYALRDYPLTRQALETHAPVIVRADDPQADPREVAALRNQGQSLLLMLSLQIGGRPIGLAEVESTDASITFTAEGLRLARGLADQAAVAINNARLFAAEQRRVALLTALHENSLDIGAQPEMTTLLQTIVERTTRLLGAPYGGLYLLRPEEQALELVGCLPVADRGLRLPLGEGMSGRVAQQGEPLLVTDYPAWPGQSALFKDGSYRSVMGAPIMRQGQVIGVLSASDSRPNRFGPPDMEALRLLATQAGVAIQTAQLFEQSQRRAEEMYLLYTMGAALSSGQDLYHALRALVKELRRLMVADVFYVVIYDEPTDQIAYPLYLNLEDDLRLPSRSLSANPGLTGEVIAARRTLYLPDISQPEVQQAHQIVVIVDMGVRSYLGIPLFIGDRIVGVLSVQARRPGAYSPEQIRLLETLATQVAATVEKSRLMEQLQQELAERKRAEAEAQQSEERYRAAITAAGMVPYVIDYRTGRFTFIGEGILTLTGYPAEALTPAMMKASIQEEYIWGAGAHLTPEGPRRRFLAGEIREWRSDMRIRTPAGASRWISDASIALLDEAGQARGAIGLLQDITERKQAEAEIRQLNAALEGRVQERTAQLEAANKELEAFSYSVSHDLRAPLRAIDGFSRVLLEEHTNRLDAEGQRYLQRVRVNTQRMGQLIDDLLKFSRLSRLPIQKRPVDPAELARQALGELRPDKGQTQADIEIADLPACQADPALLRLVFVNLLDNALKYSSRRTPARIAVGWQPPGPQGEGAYFVRDNGVGFDMQYADKLFGVFQRLHGAEEFEGTGVGLATVARILRRHGGRIWAEAEVNKGATFFFTLGQEAP